MTELLELWLRPVLGAEAVLMVTGILLIFITAFWRAAERRWAAPHRAYARSVLAAVIGGQEGGGAASVLERVPRRILVEVILELAPNVSGVQADLLTELARRIGLTAEAERGCPSRFWWRRLDSARLLTRLRSGADTMVPLLWDPDPRVRAQAAEWAADHSDPETVRRLVEMLDDPTKLCQFTAQDSLLRLRQAAVGPLIEFIESVESPPPAALQVAAAIGDPGFLSPALRLSGHPSPAVRASAAAVLSAIGGARAESALVTALADPAALVRAAAAEGLGRLSHWSAAPALAARVADPEWSVARSAARALLALGAPGRLMLRRIARQADGRAAAMARQVLETPQLRSLP